MVDMVFCCLLAACLACFLLGAVPTKRPMNRVKEAHAHNVSRYNVKNSAGPSAMASINHCIYVVDVGTDTDKTTIAL